MIIFPVTVVYTLRDMKVTKFASSSFSFAVVGIVIVNWTDLSMELRSIWKSFASTSFGRPVIPSSTNLKNISAILSAVSLPSARGRIVGKSLVSSR